MWKRNSVEYCSSSKMRPRRLRLGRKRHLTFPARCLRAEATGLWWPRLLPVPGFCFPLLGGACRLCLIFCDSRAAKPSGTFPRQTSQPLICFFFLGQLPLLVPTKNLTHTCHGILHLPFSLCQNHAQKGALKKMSDFLISEATGSSPPICLNTHCWGANQWP